MPIEKKGKSAKRKLSVPSLSSACVLWTLMGKTFRTENGISESLFFHSLSFSSWNIAAAFLHYPIPISSLNPLVRSTNYSLIIFQMSILGIFSPVAKNCDEIQLFSVISEENSGKYFRSCVWFQPLLFAYTYEFWIYPRAQFYDAVITLLIQKYAN